MLTVGEFARLGSVSVRRLRHWDAIGLLVPERVDRFTGYRYYAPAQLPRLNRIVVLRELGFGLDAIAEMIEATSQADLERLLRERKAALEGELAERKRQLTGVSVRLNALERYGTLPDYEIIIKTLPAVRFAALSTEIHGFGMANVRQPVRGRFKALRALMEAHGIEPAGAPFVTYDDARSEGGALLAYASLPLPAGSWALPAPAGIYELSAVRSALSVLRHLDEPDRYNEVYSELETWARDNGWEPVGNGRDIIVQSVDGKPAVMETQWPVKRPGTRSPSVVPVPV